MAPLNEEQLQQIRGERKEQIMEAALKVFARRGIIGTKMSLIATEAGISPGLLYRYFKSKDELFNTLVQNAMKESVSEIGNIYHLPGSPMDKIKILTEHILDESGQLYFLLVHQARTSEEVPEETKQLIEQHSLDTFVDLLESLFIEGQKNGEIAAGDPRKLIASYYTVLSGLMTLNIHGEDSYHMPEVDRLLRIISAD
ncbi:MULTISPECIES: TetR/AcrR family transcriptional regulator [Bacillus]|uniref:TetR family transcriptional regulator n=2 Tax=Bacillus TaxID=1386 RepID=A0A0M4FH94_9BACI|nr:MULTISPECIES: TetR/AcrR family transcriptional regulator [Bacillus]ALC80379.1 TetR family transcriptional regulator [Bacillus gobiensis]MBP1083771.1 AcrR family transcriptional regulator [Bacillus capparidis]MED1098256.1 TetR/AcrR family transcriptional regulator [Bacillus capparidis]